ncbi:MAG: hydrogenase maturation nickel metallochaperone HypA [Proteobacteria bacterium]|nr:hydrogenase maturation nickel metallochaperone HypA [Pseudomonadota bacterium]
MHELTLAEHALRIVEKSAHQADATRVTRIKLAIGALAHVDPETMRYCCEMVSRGTLADGACIEIVHSPGRACCADCGAEVELKQLGESCPHCGSYRLDVCDGDQMLVVDIGIV